MFLILLSLLLLSSAFATWSVIAIDQDSKRVVIASATCLEKLDDLALMSVQAVVVPNMGVAACQAKVDLCHHNQMLVFEELKKGTHPSTIIALLSRYDPLFESRQFGILDVQGRMAGHSGTENKQVSTHIQGQVPNTHIFYSIQGNILRTDDVVPKAKQAFIEHTGSLTDRVMAAMEAADDAGGDIRCKCPTDSNECPTDSNEPKIPCDNKNAEVAYILASDSGDQSGSSHNNGKYALYLTVSQPGLDNGSNQIKANENLNPVKTLRLRYDEWKKNPQGRGVDGLPSPLHALPDGVAETCEIQNTVRRLWPLMNHKNDDEV